MIRQTTRRRGSFSRRRKARRGRPAPRTETQTAASGGAEGRGRTRIRWRTGLRTPILAILFLVGLKSWLRRGPWVVTRRLRGHSAQVHSVAFSPDGRRIATASADGTARVWDAEDGECLLVLRGHERGVNTACYSPDGERIVTAGDDRTARVWDAESGESLLVLEEPERWTCKARFSPDGKRVVTEDSVSRDVWDAETGTLLAELPTPARRTCCAFSPDGKRIVAASTDHTTRVWDAETFECLAVLKTEPEDLAGPDYCGSLDPYYACAAFSPDGTRIVSGSAGTARVRDAKTGRLLHVLGRHELPVCFAEFSPDGGRILTAETSHVLRMWDAATGRHLFSVHEWPADWDDTPGFQGAAFSPDGSRFVTMSEDRTSHVWDAQTGERLARLGGLAVGSAAAFSPDGRRVVTAVRFRANEMFREAERDGRRARIWRRRRPERLYGILWLPEVWLTIAVGVAFVASLARDVRG